MFKKYRLKEKYRKKLSHFLIYQMKMMITVSLVVVGMSSLLTNVYAQNEVYGIYKNDNKVYECDSDGTNVSSQPIEYVNSITHLYIDSQVTTISQINSNSNKPILVHTVEFKDHCLVETIDNDAFKDFVNLGGSLNLSNLTNLENIDFKPFANTQIKSIQLPASVNNINAAAFLDCQSLESITVANGNTTFYSQDGVLFKKASGNDGEALYRYPEAKTGEKYIIPNNIKIINSDSFYDTKYLKNVVIPATVTDINGAAFAYSKVEKISFHEGSQLKNISYGAFAGSMLSEIDLPEGLKTIDVGAFSMTQLSIINIPQSVTNIESEVFRNCPHMTAINIAEGNQHYQSDNGVLYTKNGKTLKAYPAAKSINTYKVKDGVNTIEVWAFSYSKNTPYVIMPTSVNLIEENAFRNSQIKGILFEGALPAFETYVFVDANADVKLYTLNSNDTGFNTSINKTIELYKEPKLSIESIHESQVGKTYQIQPTLNDNATFKNDIGYTYTSTDPTIASVNQSGLVTMHKAGTTSIKVTAADPFRQSVATMSINVKGIVDEENQETPNQSENNATPGQPETRPQKNQKGHESNNQVKTSDETMIIGMIGMLLLSGIAIFRFKGKEI